MRKPHLRERLLVERSRELKVAAHGIAEQLCDEAWHVGWYNHSQLRLV